MGFRRASREAADKPWVDRAARVGLAVRGVVFLLLAYLVARVASGALGGASTKTAVSGSGVAQAVAAQSGGLVLVFLLGVGLACYAGFAALDAALVAESSDAKRWAKRGQGAWRAAVYAAFSVYAIYTAFEPGNRSGSSKHENKEQAYWSARVLDWPLGWLWLGALGLGLLGGAGYLAWKGASRKFMDDFDKRRMSSRAERLGSITGAAGHVGRGALYGIAGWFITQAAVQNDPSDSQGVDGSIRSFADNAFGSAVLYVIAAALVAFGVYMFVQARYRRV